VRVGTEDVAQACCCLVHQKHKKDAGRGRTKSEEANGGKKVRGKKKIGKKPNRLGGLKKGRRREQVLCTNTKGLDVITGDCGTENDTIAPNKRKNAIKNLTPQGKHTPVRSGEGKTQQAGDTLDAREDLEAQTPNRNCGPKPAPVTGRDRQRPFGNRAVDAKKKGKRGQDQKKGKHDIPGEPEGQRGEIGQRGKRGRNTPE